MAHFVEINLQDKKTGDDSPTVKKACDIIQKIVGATGKIGELPPRRGFQFSFTDRDGARNVFPEIVKELSKTFGKPEFIGTYKEHARWHGKDGVIPSWKWDLNVAVSARNLTVTGSDWKPTAPGFRLPSEDE